jgi:hypothetical protein
MQLLCHDFENFVVHILANIAATTLPEAHQPLHQMRLLGRISLLSRSSTPTQACHRPCSSVPDFFLKPNGKTVFKWTTF